LNSKYLVCRGRFSKFFSVKVEEFQLGRDFTVFLFGRMGTKKRKTAAFAPAAANTSQGSYPLSSEMTGVRLTPCASSL
jgi:hypothetical protein